MTHTCPNCGGPRRSDAQYCSRECYRIGHGQCNVSDEDFQWRVALLIAFTHYHEQDGAMPYDTGARRLDIIQGLMEQGLLEDDGRGYRITQRGIAAWWEAVDIFDRGITGHYTPDILKHYNEDGTRKDKSA